MVRSWLRNREERSLASFLPIRPLSNFGAAIFGSWRAGASIGAKQGTCLHLLLTDSLGKCAADTWHTLRVLQFAG
jgi:hypothetical protein